MVENIPGSVYVSTANGNGVVILDPSEGVYQSQVLGNPGATFSLSESFISPNANTATSPFLIDEEHTGTIGLSGINTFDFNIQKPVLPPISAILPGFNSHSLSGNDDGSTGAVSLGFTVNFFGQNYTSLFINNNGNVTFDAPLSTFTPFSLTSTGRVIIAPFFADVDTRVGNVVTYGTGTVDGHLAFGVTWPGVGYFSEQTNKLNTFQVVLVDRSDTGPGNVDIEFNYGQIQWETGQASGGVNGLGGSSARVGFSNGTGQPGTFFELPGSGVNGAFLDSNPQTGLIHLPPQVFEIRSGAPDQHTTAAFLQANLDGTTTVQPTSTLIGQEPTITTELEDIVQFRVQAGLTNSATQLTTELVDGLVEDGIAPRAVRPNSLTPWFSRHRPPLRKSRMYAPISEASRRRSWSRAALFPGSTSPALTLSLPPT